jgi:hypothetical protein
MDKLEEILAEPRAKAFDPAAVCKTYETAKPLLNAVLPILDNMPVIGKITAAMRLLILIADSFYKIRRTE